MKFNFSKLFCMVAVVAILFGNVPGAGASPSNNSQQAQDTYRASTVFTRMLIPLYSDPQSGNWATVIAANTYQNIDVIINPSNGVGASRRNTYVQGVTSLRGAGIKIYGYISTLYGARDINSVKTEIDTWVTWYAPDGIFLDETDNTNSATKLAYYTELFNYLRSKNLGVVTNPGTSTVESYIGVTDTACIYESAPRSPIPYPNWGSNYPIAKFCALSYGANRDQMLRFVSDANGRFGYVFVTSDTLPNPWDNLPTYLAEEAALLAVGTAPTNTPTTVPSPVPSATLVPTEAPSLTPTPASTATEVIIATPTSTQIAPTGAPTETPISTNTPAPVDTPVSTNTPIPTVTLIPSGATVLTSATPKNLFPGERASVIVSLNNLPADGYDGAEFTCTYPVDLITVGNILISGAFGTDPVSTYTGSQNGSFIVAVAGSNGQKASASGTAFSFEVTAVKPGSITLDCQARMLRGSNPLETIPSIAEIITVVENLPTVTATAIPAPMLNGRVTAAKPVTISLFKQDATLVTSIPANPDGTFSLTAAAGTYIVVASAEGYLNAQGTATLADGIVTTLPLITLPAGDIDGNDVIDQYDAMTVGMSYNSITPATTDLSNDSLTNIIDLDLLADNYRKSGSLAWQ